VLALAEAAAKVEQHPDDVTLLEVAWSRLTVVQRAARRSAHLLPCGAALLRGGRPSPSETRGADGKRVV